jgi:hypothetical protein
MNFSRPIQWYHSHADPIWPDSTFKDARKLPVNMDFAIHYPLREKINIIIKSIYFLTVEI